MWDSCWYLRSGDHQLRLVVEITIFGPRFLYIQKKVVFSPDFERTINSRTWNLIYIQYQQDIPVGFQPPKHELRYDWKLLTKTNAFDLHRSTQEVRTPGRHTGFIFHGWAPSLGFVGFQIFSYAWSTYPTLRYLPPRNKALLNPYWPLVS